MRTLTYQRLKALSALGKKWEHLEDFKRTLHSFLVYREIHFFLDPRCLRNSSASF
jgi:hypothetical protein